LPEEKTGGGGQREKFHVLFGTDQHTIENLIMHSLKKYEGNKRSPERNDFSTGGKKNDFLS
jgi:hypothetical protein